LIFSISFVQFPYVGLPVQSDRWNPEYKVCSIRNLVEESIGIVFVHAKKGNIEFAYVLDSSCPKEATTDAARVMQVLVNLISNSIKNTEQGSIVVRVTCSGPEMLQFEVRDTGIGVLPEHQPSLFKKFCRIPNKFNEHLGGVGLGLAICKKVTHKLGGHIWLESTGVPGEGTKVTFTISVSEPRSVSPPPHRIGTSLLIATSAPLREQLTEQFNFLGLTVAHTNTIEEALDEGRRPSKPFCAILIDPDRAGLNWNDPKTQTRLDELGLLGPVTIMVSQTLSPMEADLVETPVVLKPIRLSVLRSIVNKCKPELDDDSEAIPTTLKNMHPLAKSSSSAYPTESRQLDSRCRRSSSLGDGTSVLNFDGLKVLIVEDNLVVQRVFKTLFTKVGAAKISIANTGVQALEVLQADPSSADVIMMDINMPEMDGVTCTGQIISEYGKGAYWIIGVSAASLEETQTYLKAGMDDFLSKPVKMDAIQGALARFHASRAKRATSMDSARQ
jgi:CheY-like chemotaxis protein